MDLSDPHSQHRRGIPQAPGVPAELRAYWQALRGGAAFPRRDRIDPRGIAGALDQSFLIERIAPGVARFRLAGMRLAGLSGMDLRGMPFSTLITPGDRDRLARALEQVFATPSILDARMEAERCPGCPALPARLLVLPLGDRNGQPTLALGCLALGADDPGRRPRRFAIAALMREALGPVPRAETDSPAQPRTDRPHLRLVHDADLAR